MLPSPTADSTTHTVRRSLRILALVTLVVFVLIQAESLLIPLAFAAVMAMLFEAPVEWLERFMPRGVAIGIVTFLLFAVMAGLFFLTGQQVADFAKDLPAIQQKAEALITDAQNWVAQTLNINQTVVEQRMDERIDAASSNLGSQASSFVGSLTGIFADLLLFFVYLILMLAQRDRLKNFVLKLTPKREEWVADRKLDDVRQVAGQYIRGRMILIAILFGIYLAGFYFANLQFAIAVAAVAALLSIIPYIGNFIAAGLVFVVAAFSDDFANTALIGLGTMAFAQVLESYVLMPLIVGKEVDLNPLTTIIAVIGFGLIWGLPGTVLAIPIVAILKQVLSVLPHGKPWAYLMSDGDE